MFKGIEFFKGKSRGKVGGGTKLTPPAPVILGLVPRIFWQRVPNLVNKLALLLHKCWLREDSWDKPKNDGCLKRLFSTYCKFFKYPSPDAKASPSPSRGEVSGLLRSARNDIERTNIAFKGLDVVRQYAALLERRVQQGTRARKALVVTRQANPLGRSMIEMLGVLAIIGVLSVGGIAGYSKAMEKFKLNKALDEYSFMIFGLLEHFDDIRKIGHISSGDTGLAELMQAIRIVPTNWKQIDASRFADSIGNYINVFYRMKDGDGERLIIDMWLGGIQQNTDGTNASGAFSNNLCVSLYQNLVQPLHKTLQYAGNYRAGSDGQHFTPFWGDAYCQNGRTCLSRMKISDFYNACNSCQKGSEICTLTLSFQELN